MKILFYIIFSSLRVRFSKFVGWFSIFGLLVCVTDGFCNFVFLLISGKKILKSSWFDHAYCGLALGYAKDHLTRDSYVRCLLCKQDVRVASRGITTFFEHCRGVTHHRLDCLTRVRRGLSLRRRDGTLMSEAESAAFVATMAGESVPQVEVCPDTSVLEALRIEAEGSSVWRDECEACAWLWIRCIVGVTFPVFNTSGT